MLSVYARLKCRTSLAEVGKIRSDPGAYAIEADLAKVSVQRCLHRLGEGATG